MILLSVKEISEMRKRMATLREDNRRLRNELMQRNFKPDSNKQDESLYYLLQEFIVENNTLRTANKELRTKAIQESKFRLKIPQEPVTLPKLSMTSPRISKESSNVSNSPFKLDGRSQDSVSRWDRY